MTLEEAIYCMTSYLPDTDVEHCEQCPYRKAVQVDEQTFTCKSSEAHRMAIEALKHMAEEEILKNCFEDSDCNDGNCPYYIEGGCLYAEREHSQKDDL